MASAEACYLEEAVELYATATSHSAAANAQWFQDILGEPIARLTEALPEDVRQAAQARGRERDPFATTREVLEKLRASSDPSAMLRSSYPARG
ncbi:MAG: hypothetical protein MUF84_18715 [Anaerolineae bacterium]|nr:hypothetical protein [Anaerolineae bacterium]